MKIKGKIYIIRQTLEGINFVVDEVVNSVKVSRNRYYIIKITSYQNKISTNISVEREYIYEKENLDQLKGKFCHRKRRTGNNN